MMLNTIWERYIFKELLKVFSFFLICFFFLYSMVDYSTHVQDFVKDKHIQFLDTLTYYGFQFLKRAELLLPLALLIATIKVLCTFNSTRELVALQASGMKLKKLLRPFFLLASLCCLFNWMNAEVLLPKSLNFLDEFREAHFRHSFTGNRKEEPFHVMHLKDNSKLVYQKYDEEKNAFFDAYWIRSFDDIWRIKFLKADPKDPIGQYVDHLQRNKEGLLNKVESYELCRLNLLKWQAKLPKLSKVPIENRKISQLYRLLFNSNSTTEFQAGEVITHLSSKLLMPLLAFLVVIAIAPYCVRYSRNIPVFFIYAVGLFAFIAFFTLMDAALILGENQTVNPFWAVFAPFSLCSAFFSWKFVKTH